MRRIAFLFVMVISCLQMWAEEFVVDNMYYRVQYPNCVALAHVGKDVLDLVCPDTVSYNGMDYVVTRIDEKACWCNSELQSVTIPNTVTEIAEMAFKNCESLTSVTIGNSVKTIGNDAFAYCKSLTSVTFGNSVEIIRPRAFEWCTSLTTITTPNSLRKIGDYAFYGCEELATVTFGNQVGLLGECVFYNCKKLKSINFPNSLKIIGEYCFAWCSIDEVHVDDRNAWLYINFANSTSNPHPRHIYENGEEVHEIIVSSSLKEIKNYAFEGCPGITSVILPNTITNIGNSAFVGSGLTSIVIPNSVKTIGGYAFGECRHLESITLSNSLTSIENATFMCCKNLTSIEIPNSVKSIGNQVFESCNSLQHVTIGSGVEKIGSRTFTKCPELKEMTCYAEEVPELYKEGDTDYNGTFADTNIEAVTLFVPEGSVGKYKTTTEQWREFGAIAAIVEDAIVAPAADDADTCRLYNLQGQRLNEAPKEGIYIKNGKKIFVR